MGQLVGVQYQQAERVYVPYTSVNGSIYHLCMYIGTVVWLNGVQV